MMAEVRSGRTLDFFGALALIIYLLHAGNHLRRGTPHDLLWICNLATALLAIGCLARRPTLVAIPLLWLAAGTPLWILDALAGSEVIATSLLTHFGGLAISTLAVGKLGMPRGTWYRAMAASAAVVVLTRLVTAPEDNVNLAHGVRAGWESSFGNHLLYLAMLFAVAGAIFFAVERLFLRLTSEAR
jgi:hypothetical protein